jgi:ribosomal protein L18
MEIFKQKPEQVIKRNGDFREYLDTKFRSGTSQNLENLLTKEMKSLTRINQDNISNPNLRLSLRNTEHTIIFQAIDISNSRTHEALDASEEEVKNKLKKGYLPIEEAKAYFILTGKKCWGVSDHKLMKKDLGKKIKSLLEDPGNGNSSPENKDKRSAAAARDAATYKLLFKEEVWSLEQKKQMLRVTEEEFEQFNKEEKFLSNNTVALSSRAATIKALGNFT